MTSHFSLLAAVDVESQLYHILATKLILFDVAVVNNWKDMKSILIVILISLTISLMPDEANEVEHVLRVHLYFLFMAFLFLLIFLGVVCCLLD